MKKRSEPYQQHINAIGERLWRLALLWSRNPFEGSKKEQKAAVAESSEIHIAGGLSGACKAVEAAVTAILAARNQRENSRRPIEMNFRDTNPWQDNPEAHALALFHHRGGTPLPKGAMQYRLASRVFGSVLSAESSTTGLWVPGNQSWRVDMTDDPTKIGAIAEIFPDWSVVYNSGCSCLKTSMRVCITVSHNWLSRVRRPGLATLGGMLTLVAQQLDCREMIKDRNVEAYAAVWARRGRGGRSYVNERGVIALVRKNKEIVESYHGSNFQQAITGLRRKCLSPDVRAQRTQDAIHGFARRWSRSQMQVTLEDAHAIGVFDFEIQSWCITVGLEAELALGIAPASLLAAKYVKLPLPGVRRAILRAARHHR
jgi:hypothetical protein